MNVKKKLSPLDQIRSSIQEQRGIFLTSDLVKLHIPRTYLCILEKNGEIERVSRGIYKSPNSLEDEMFVFQAVYKSSIFSHETALYLHDLTDKSPLFYSVTVPVGYHSISLTQSGYKIFYLSRKLFDLGVVSVKSSHGNEVRVTNLERTICDIVRSRNQMDAYLVKDALKRYAQKKGKNLSMLYSHAKAFRIQKIIREYMEILL